MKAAAAILLTMSMMFVTMRTSRTIVEGRRLILRPLKAREVYGMLRDAGREDAIPQGRVITQGIAAIKGFALGVKTGVGGSLAVDLAAAGGQQLLNSANLGAITSNIQLPTINVSALSLPQINANSFQLPQFNVSALSLPQLNVNALSLPSFNVSALSLPQLSLPQFNVPQISQVTQSLSQSLPQLSQLSLSNVQLPQFFNFNNRQGSTTTTTNTATVQVEDREICFSTRNARSLNKFAAVPVVDSDYDVMALGRQAPTTTDNAAIGTATNTGSFTGTNSASGGATSGNTETTTEEDPETTTCLVLQTPVARRRRSFRKQRELKRTL